MFDPNAEDHFAPVDADGYAYCPRCKGDITADDAESFAVCETCWQAELAAQRETDAEFDRLYAELAQPEPELMPVCCGDECPW